MERLKMHTNSHTHTQIFREKDQFSVKTTWMAFQSMQTAFPEHAN